MFGMNNLMLFECNMSLFIVLNYDLEFFIWERLYILDVVCDDEVNFILMIYVF